MKFICKQQALMKALNTVSKAVSTKTTIPILKGILLEAKNGELKLSASDLDLSIEKKAEVSVQEEGSCVAPAKLFIEIIRKLPNTDIVVEEQDSNIVIKTEKSEFTLVGMPADEFPSLNLMEEESSSLSLDKGILSEMIKKTAFAASIDESKGVIVGLLLEMEEESMNMVSLDGFRMAVVREPMKNAEKKNIIISAKIFNELQKIIAESDGEGDMSLKIGSKKAEAVIDDTKIEMRLMEGNFVKYKDILPKEHKTEVVVNRGDLSDSIERAALFAKEGKNNLIKLSITDNLLTIVSRSEEGNVREEVYISKEGDDLEIGFNSKYMLDVLKVLDDEEVKLEFNTHLTPCMVKPLAGNAYEYLVLPVRI